jgi:hypothetical protein
MEPNRRRKGRREGGSGGGNVRVCVWPNEKKDEVEKGRKTKERSKATSQREREMTVDVST